MFARYSKSDIKNLSGRTVFFDANILIYLYWPTFSYPNQVRNYSKIFGDLLKQKNEVYTNATVISEVVNRILRLECSKLGYNVLADFKTFRNSDDGISVQNDVFNIVKNKILKNFIIADKEFSSKDIESFLKIDSLDFNDKMIADICKTRNLILLTNDADFSNEDIEILSVNSKLK